MHPDQQQQRQRKYRKQKQRHHHIRVHNPKVLLDVFVDLKESQLVFFIMNQVQYEMYADDENPVQSQKQQHNERNEPTNVMFSHTIIYPRAVVVVLSDTCVANVTVVGSERFALNTTETYRL